VKFINKHGLKSGKILAFYPNYKNPINLEAAIEVDKIPLALSKNIHSKIIEGVAMLLWPITLVLIKTWVMAIMPLQE